MAPRESLDTPRSSMNGTTYFFPRAFNYRCGLPSFSLSFGGLKCEGLLLLRPHPPECCVMKYPNAWSMTLANESGTAASSAA